jgi:hypothetical protein
VQCWREVQTFVNKVVKQLRSEFYFCLYSKKLEHNNMTEVTEEHKERYVGLQNVFINMDSVKEKTDIVVEYANCLRRDREEVDFVKLFDKCFTELKKFDADCKFVLFGSAAVGTHLASR